MTSPAIEGISSLLPMRAGPDLSAGAPQPVAHAGGGFASLFEREVARINADVGAAESAMRDLAVGKPIELHEAMIRLERARLSVQVFVQVRNKVIESYQDLMRMQA